MTSGPPATVRESHTAVVVLVGDRAFKLKKAVNLGFLDFSTRARRLAACRREVELNRRSRPTSTSGSPTFTAPTVRSATTSS